MSRLWRLAREQSGSAAAELAMITPLLSLLLFVPVELGRYFQNQHALVKAVRDGAVYAARQPIDSFDCSATTPTVASAVTSATQTLVKTGGLSGDANLLTQWTKTGSSVTLSLACVTTAGTTTLGGVYTANGGKVPVITLSASLPYAPMIGWLGYDWTGATLHASQQAVVTGL